MVRLFTRTLIGIALNSFVIIVISVSISVIKNKFFVTFGPRDDLLFMTAVINTWRKYVTLLCVTSFTNAIHIIVGDYSFPIILFTVYNHESTVVYGFSRAQLQTCSTLLSLTASITHVFSINTMISGMDVALVATCAGEIAAFTISFYLIKKKTKFVKKYDNEKEMEESQGSSLLQETGTCVLKEESEQRDDFF